jgi:preprotein translocase subunit SecA
MNFSRKELIETDATMNQMRNSIYILARLMEKNGISDLKQKLRKMGQNIARTYLQYWIPIDTVNFSNLKDVITTIYQKVLNSSISIEIDNVENVVKVQDYRCALCKYHYDDVEIAGCEIILGLVSEFINLLNKKSNEQAKIILKPEEVVESRAYGGKSCIQLFKYKIGEEG